MSTATPRLDIPDLLRAVSQLDRDARALQIDGLSYTWGNLVDGVEALQAALAREGLSGDALPVGIVMRTSVSTVAGLLALLMNRQTLFTLNHMQSNQRLAASLGNLAAAAVVANPEDWTEEMLKAVRDAGMLGLSVSPSESTDINVVCPRLVTDDQVDALRRPGIALSMLTSGTTGPPKRIPLTYEQWARGIAGGLHFTSAHDAKPRLRTGVALLTTPLTHLGGAWRIVFSFLSGRAIAMLPRFEVDAWVALVREHHPPIVTVPPPVLQMLLDAAVPVDDLSSLKAVMVGTAPLDPDLAERFEDTYGVAVLANYGATEFAGAVASWTLVERQRYRTEKRGSVGRAHPEVSLRVVDAESGEAMSAGQVGLLEVKAPQLEPASLDGWLRTNDLAALDEDGFLFIHGRADDAIIRGGFKVSAGEVAAILRLHPEVSDAAVIGRRDERLGEVPVAVVELRPGSDADPEHIREWARERLMSYQLPVKVIAVPRLPRSAMMKVDAIALRELVGRHLEED